MTGRTSNGHKDCDTSAPAYQFSGKGQPSLEEGLNFTDRINAKLKLMWKNQRQRECNCICANLYVQLYV